MQGEELVDDGLVDPERGGALGCRDRELGLDVAALEGRRDARPRPGVEVLGARRQAEARLEATPVHALQLPNPPDLAMMAARSGEARHAGYRHRALALDSKLILCPLNTPNTIYCVNAGNNPGDRNTRGKRAKRCFGLA